MKVSCPEHGEHEAYEGARECPVIAAKVNYLARKHGVDPLHIISTGKIKEPIEAELLGYTDRRGEYV